MASVTEEMLQNIASDIVRDFNSGGISLTEGVRKKASENGFNREQTARLIERTNSDAFMSLFPKQTEFPVASPEEVMGEKVASVQEIKKPTYKEKLARDPYEIFGVANEKTASCDVLPPKLAFNAYKEYLALNAMRDEYRVTKLAEEIQAEDLSAQFFELVKEAVYQGESISSIEGSLLHAIPSQPEMVCDVVTELVTKLARDPFLDGELLKRATTESFDPDKCVEPTKISDAFKVLFYGNE